MTTERDSQGETPEPRALRLEQIDALRGIAALLVTWFHIYQKNPTVRPENGVFESLMNVTSLHGWLGVPVFFVITGFVIPLALHRSLNGRTLINGERIFLAKRITRLYPPYLAAVFLTFAIMHTAPLFSNFKGNAPIFDGSWLLADAFMISPIFEIPWSNPVFWSLLVEMQFYFVVAACIYVGKFLPSNRIYASVIFCIIICVISSLSARNLNSFITSAPLFCIGYGLFLYERQLCNKNLIFFMFFVAAATLLFRVHPGKNDLAQLLVALFTVVIIKSRWNPGSFVVFLGTMSYSIYLIHYPIGVRAVRLFYRIDVPAMNVLSYFAAFALTLAISWIFYTLFERPSMRLSGRIAYPRSVSSFAQRG